MELGSMSREELEQLIADAQAALTRLTAVWEVEQQRAWTVRELERLAGNLGAVPADPVPEGGFMPGQVVNTGDNGLYINSAGTWIDYPPGEEPLSAWLEIDDEPEPDPDPEPDPTEPEYEDWQQPSAGSEYDPGAKVTHNGHLWRNDHTGPNGWEPGTVHSQWTDLGPVN